MRALFFEKLSILSHALDDETLLPKLLRTFCRYVRHAQDDSRYVWFCFSYVQRFPSLQRLWLTASAVLQRYFDTFCKRIIMRCDQGSCFVRVDTYVMHRMKRDFLWLSVRIKYLYAERATSPPPRLVTPSAVFQRCR